MNLHLSFIKHLFFWLIFSVSAGAKVKILIDAGDTYRGGFGDVASNLVVAEMLALDPNLEVTLLVNQHSEKAVKILTGVIDTSGVHKNVNYKYVDSYDPVKSPPTDISLKLAVSQFGTPPLNGKINLAFNEYGDNSEAGIDPRLKNLGHLVYRFNTGLRAGHLYLSPSSDAQTLSRSELFSQLNVSDPNAKLAYAHYEDDTALGTYLQSISKIIPDRQKVIVFASHTPKGFVDIPPNIELVSKSHTLDTAKAVIKNSDFPVLVTGDVSWSLAWQYAKPFVLEVPTWKRESFSDLVNFLKVRGFEESAFLDPKENTIKKAKKLQAFLTDKKAQEELSTKLSGTISELSIVEAIKKVATLLEQPNFHSKDSFEVEEQLKEVLAKKTNTPPTDKPCSVLFKKLGEALRRLKTIF